MRFACKNCGVSSSIPVGCLLSEANCSHCANPLELSDDQVTVRGYRLEKNIGVGGYGTVWKVCEPDSGHTRALKLIPKHIVPENESIHLLREVRSSRYLDHPNIVAATEFGETNDYWFLVSDYVDGKPLDQWARDFEPTMSEAVELCADVADVMHYVHEQGFIHRDLKPGNILIDDHRRPFIIDFGLCRSARDRDLNDIERYRRARHRMSEERPDGGVIFGTPAYVAPEQASGNGMESSPQSDIYSLGVILYELLTGVRPYQGAGRHLIRKILAGRPRRPRRIRREISKEMEAICLKAISRKAAERYATCVHFADDCRKAVAGEAISVKVRRHLFR